MFTWLQRIASLRTFWASFAAFVLINILYDVFNVPQLVVQSLGYRGTLSWYAIDEAIGASSATIYGYLTTYGPGGREAILIDHLTFDTLFPLTYMLFFTITLTMLGRGLFRRTGNWRWLTLTPVFAGLFDYLENIGIVTMCLTYPMHLTRTVASITSIFTLLKVTFLGGSVVLIVVGGISLLLRWAITTTSNASRTSRKAPVAKL